ncbi:MAG: DUF433 domain-containing protein [Bryobacterales bacterium]|nr:DUF433 domain-containing protein [Bryobacterales bacterium]MDE0296889.1 DUF433 domain-containing protein [Bryobacterales bacterium]
MYGHQAHTVDARDLPTYTIPEAAHYLGVPAATVRYWSVGQGAFGPLIRASSLSPPLLSFLNLTELHVLTAIRRKHGVSMPKVRKAIDYLVENVLDESEQRHPLISRKLETDDLNLFIEQYGQLINISQGGQTAMREIINAALKRIDRDSHGIPIKFYPFTRAAVEDAPTMIVINPGISAGRPVINGTGFATEVIAERWKAGESVGQLAEDYEREAAEIEEAIRCEFRPAA